MALGISGHATKRLIYSQSKSFKLAAVKGASLFLIAEVAQLAEHCICNARVVGSTPIFGSKKVLGLETLLVV